MSDGAIKVVPPERVNELIDLFAGEASKINDKIKNISMSDSSGNNVGSRDMLSVYNYFIPFYSELLDGCEFISDGDVLHPYIRQSSDQCLIFNFDRLETKSGWSGPISVFKKGANMGYSMARLVVQANNRQMTVPTNSFPTSGSTAKESLNYTADVALYSAKEASEEYLITQITPKSQVTGSYYKSYRIDIDLAAITGDVFVHVDIIGPSEPSTSANVFGVAIGFGNMLLY